MATSRPVPHPKDYPLLGSVPAFIRDTPQTFVDGWREVGDIVRFRGLRSMCLTVHPDFVKHVLEDNQQNYRRSDTVTQALTMLLGESTFTATGDPWRQRARLVHPLLDPQRLPGFDERVAGAAADTASRWERTAGTGATVDLYEEMLTTTLDAAARILFGDDRGGDFARFREAAITANEYVIAKTMAVGGPPDVRIRPAYRRYLRAVADLDQILLAAAAARRRQPREDLVSALVQAGDAGVTLADREVRDEALTFLHTVYAGVASALMWVLVVLADHDDARQRLVAELEGAIGETQATLESTRDLHYLGLVVDETLRLYPSLWVFAQVPIEDDVIGGYDIPAGLSVVICPYITHRHPEFWESPETFEPERFEPERARGRHAYAYFPFSGGPRGCPARELGLAMTRIAIATLVPRYRILRVAGHSIERRREFVLRPANGLPVTLELARP